MNILQFSFAMATLLLYSTAHADYSMRYLGSIASSNESLIDASENGWLLLRDSSDDCLIRTKYNSGKLVRLCEHGLKDATKINNQGDVLGTVAEEKKIAVWSDKRGLSIFETPSDQYDSLTPADINNKGEVVGYSSSRDLESEYAYKSQAYRWSSSGSISRINIGDSYSIKAVSLNDKGSVVAWKKVSANSGGKLYIGVRKFKPIRKNIKDDIYGEYDSVEMNNRGQIARGESYIFTPKTGWRKVPIISIGRNDYQATVAISESGKALFNSNSGYLSTYPKPAIQLSCYLPQNRKVINTQATVEDLQIYNFEARFFLNDSVIFSTDIRGDSKGTQLFVLEQGKKTEQAIQDYCPTISTVGELDCSNYNDISSGPHSCSGRFAVTNSQGALNGFEVKLYAKEPKNNNGCTPVLIDTFTTHPSGNTFSFQADPRFEYYVTLTDPRFGSIGTNQLTYADTVDSPICHTPLGD